MSKVFILLADGFEEVEAMTPVDLLRRAGAEVTMVSVTGGKVVTGARRIPVVTDLLIGQQGEGDMLILPGGMPGTTHLKEHAGVRNLVQDFYDQGKYIAAICAAPTVFGDMGLLRGRHATCYPGLEGGLIGAKVSTDSVVVDGNIITSRGVGTALDFACKLIELLFGKEKADEIAKSVVYFANNN